MVGELPTNRGVESGGFGKPDFSLGEDGLWKFKQGVVDAQPDTVKAVLGGLNEVLRENVFERINIRPTDPIVSGVDKLAKSVMKGMSNGGEKNAHRVVAEIAGALVESSRMIGSVGSVDKRQAVVEALFLQVGTLCEEMGMDSARMAGAVMAGKVPDLTFVRRLGGVVDGADDLGDESIQKVMRPQLDRYADMYNIDPLRFRKATRAMYRTLLGDNPKMDGWWNGEGQTDAGGNATPSISTEDMQKIMKVVFEKGSGDWDASQFFRPDKMDGGSGAENQGVDAGEIADMLLGPGPDKEEISRLLREGGFGGEHMAHLLTHVGHGVLANLGRDRIKLLLNEVRDVKFSLKRAALIAAERYAQQLGGAVAMKNTLSDTRK